MKFMKITEAVVGQKIRLDAGFTCVEPDATRTITADDDGNLYFECSRGHHYLDGQLNDHKNDLIGIYKAD